MTRAPAPIRWSGAIAGPLLRIGMPMGPNRVLTVRGRKSGEPRPAPVAVVEIEGRRWVVGTFGEVQWVRNLRAAGEAELLVDGRQVQVAAHELDRQEARAFYGEFLPRYVAGMPRVSQPVLRFFIRRFAPEVFDDPTVAAANRPVFELREQNGGQPVPRDGAAEQEVI